MNNLFFIFIALNIVNVVMQTLKTLFTVKGNKYTAALVNAVTFGLYTVVIVYTVCELPLWEKVAIVAVCNFIGVFVVKAIEEKLQKDKLWKIEATVQLTDFAKILNDCKLGNISYNFTSVKNNEKKYYVFNFYCNTQKQSETVANWLKNLNCKYFVSEHKTNLY